MTFPAFEPWSLLAACDAFANEGRALAVVVITPRVLAETPSETIDLAYVMGVRIELAAKEPA